MGNPVFRIFARGLRWLSRRPSYMLLMASPAELAAEPPERFRRSWVGLLALSLAWGLASIGLYAWAVRVDYTNIPLLPAVVVLIPMALWIYRRAISSLAAALAGDESAGTAVAAAVLVVALLMAIIGLKRGDPDWCLSRWSWVCPRALYRALILAPLWGAWSMLIVGQFCKPTPKTEPAVAAMCRGCGPMAAAVAMAALLAVTVQYFQYLEWWRFGVAAVTILASLAGGAVLCRAGGGLRRDTLLACNLLTQIAFLFSYLAGR